MCENAVVIDQCESNVRLEMVQADPRNFSADAPNTADCINAANDPRPVRNFEHGMDNQLMLIRACLKFKPMIPFTSLGAELNVDDEGYAQLVATSAFVQEPR